MNAPRFLGLFVFTATLTAGGSLADSSPKAPPDCSDDAVRAQVASWESEHPVDPVVTDRKARQEYTELHQAMASQLAGNCPESYLALWQRFQTLPKDLPPGEVADTALRLVGWYRGRRTSWRSWRRCRPTSVPEEASPSSSVSLILQSLESAVAGCRALGRSNLKARLCRIQASTPNRP